MKDLEKAWKIFSDPINNGAVSELGTWGNENGVCLIRDGKVKGITRTGESVCTVPDDNLDVKFRVKDDDGEVYYEGRMSFGLADSSDILRPLDDFAMPNTGAVTLEIWQSAGGGQWVAVN